MPTPIFNPDERYRSTAAIRLMALAGQGHGEEFIQHAIPKEREGPVPPGPVGEGYHVNCWINGAQN